MPEVTAYHEAGHALMATSLGGRVRCVTIEPDWDDGPERYGDTQVEWPIGQFTDREFREKMMAVSLAGPVAEMIYTGDLFHPDQVPEWAADWNEAWQAASGLIADEVKRLRFLEQASIRLHETLRRADHWAALAAIADNLLAHETLEAEQVEEIVAAWLD